MRGLISTLITAFAIMLGGITIMLISFALLGAAPESLLKQDLGEEKTVTVSSPVTSLQMEVGGVNVEIAAAEDGTCSVSYSETEKITYEVVNDDGILTVRRNDSRKWYERIILFSFKSPVMTVRLPRGEYTALSVQSGASGITVAEGLVFGKATVKATSGSVRYLGDATEELNLTATSGDVFVKGVSVKQLQCKMSSGRLALEDITCDRMTLSGVSGSAKVTNAVVSEGLSITQTSGSVRLTNAFSQGDFSVKVTSGSIRLDRCDGMKISLETTSGSVRGTLCSPKVFNVKVTSGSVRVPDSVPNGGLCSVKTTSGSVNIEIAE